MHHVMHHVMHYVMHYAMHYAMHCAFLNYEATLGVVHIVMMYT